MTRFGMLLIFIVFISLNIYLFIRGWQALPAISLVHSIYTLLFIIVSSAVFIAVFASEKLPLWIGRFFDILGGYWIILFIFIFAVAFFGDVLRLLNHFFGIFPPWVTNNYQKAKMLYLISSFLIIGFLSLIGYIRFINPRITQLNITLDNKKNFNDKIKIVAISDIHLGNLIRKKRFENWVKIINKQKPDIILIGGDLFDHNMRTVESQQLDTTLLKLDAKYGIYAIPGNHDYYAGIDKAVNYMIKSGIKVLRDQSITIEGKIILIGRDDITNRKRKPLNDLLNGMNTNLPKILMDHQPFSLRESADNSIDLHFSGHTHNGQIFPFNIIVSKIYELGYGYKKTGITHYYVSSGLGLWGAPIRLGTNSEIVSITIDAQK